MTDGLRSALPADVLLDTLFTSAPVGLAFFDRDLRYVRINEALAEINGLPAADHLGRTVPELLPDMDPEVVAGFRRVIETGEPLTDVSISGETPARPGVTRHWTCGWYPVFAPGTDEVLGLGAVVLEDTARVAALEAERAARDRAERAEVRSRLLARVGLALAGVADPDVALPAVARAAVPDKADWCTIDLLRPDGRLERVGAAHVDPELAVELQAAGGGRPSGPTGVFGAPHVVATGRVQVLPEGAAGLLEGAGVPPSCTPAAALAVPVLVGERPVGALTFAVGDRERAGRLEVELAEEVARRVAQALETSRLSRERALVAETLERGLQPQPLPDVPGFELAARYRPAGEAFEVGGDFYDVSATAEDTWCIVLGDVCGKGPGAAALTALARYTVRAAAQLRGDPRAVLDMLNDAIVREHGEDRFMTAIGARLVLDGRLAQLDVAVAGHPPALLLCADGTRRQLEADGTVLGLEDRDPGTRVRLALEPGDLLVLFTDGLLDAGAPARMLDPDDLFDVAAAHVQHGADAVVGALEAAALAAAGPRPPRDDLAIVALRRLA